MFPKQTREVNEDYLEFIRKQPCCISGENAEPHHLKSVGSGGSDMSCVPLSRKLHTEVHMMGRSRFEAKYEIRLNDVNMEMRGKYELS